MKVLIYIVLPNVILPPVIHFFFWYIIEVLASDWLGKNKNETGPFLVGGEHLCPMVGYFSAALSLLDMWD